MDMRPTCHICGRPGLLGQMSPLWDYMVCRECSEDWEYPVNIFEPGGNDRSGVRIKMDAPSDLKEHRIWLDNMLKDIQRGYIDDRPVVKFNLSGRELRNPIRRSKHATYNAMHKRAVTALNNVQMTLPYCRRCGCAHDRRYEIMPGRVDYWEKCQRCADEEAVEALWRLRAIFGGDDVEAIMDRVYKSHQELFERGVLPDYWFKLMEGQ